MRRAERPCGAVVLALLLVAQTARGEPDPGAPLLEQGVRAFDRGEFEQAQRLLERARLAARQDGTLGRIELHLGLTRAVMGDELEARGHFRRALDHEPTLSVDPQRYKPEVVRLFRETLAPLQGALSVTANTAGCRVEVDGRDLGATPLRRQLGIGRHTVRVIGPGGAVLRDEQVTLYPNRAAEIAVELAPTPRPHRPRRRVWTWVAAGGAAAALGLGIGLYAWAGADHDEYLQTSDPQRFDELSDSIRRRDIAANVLWGVAGVLAATSVALFFLEGRARPAGEGRARRPTGLVLAF